MKKLTVFYVILCMLVISCMHHDKDLNISYSNSDHFYSMDAGFRKSRTRAVERYIDSKIGRRSNTSFTNTRINGTITLDDHTTFYVEKSPGVLKIKLDKDKNSEEAYQQVRLLCEGVKAIVSDRP